jgi:hypothetical protein
MDDFRVLGPAGGASPVAFRITPAISPIFGTQAMSPISPLTTWIWRKAAPIRNGLSSTVSQALTATAPSRPKNFSHSRPGSIQTRPFATFFQAIMRPQPRDLSQPTIGHPTPAQKRNSLPPTTATASPARRATRRSATNDWSDNTCHCRKLPLSPLSQLRPLQPPLPAPGTLTRRTRLESRLDKPIQIWHLCPKMD